MSLAPSKHISYHCRIASRACIIFPSAPLHTFNWQAGVNKIHTSRTQQNTHKSSGAGALSLLFRRSRRQNIEHINHTSCCLCFNWHRLRINYIKVRGRARANVRAQVFAIGRRRRLAFIYPAAVAARGVRGRCSAQLSIYKTNKQTTTPACESHRNGVLWASKYTHIVSSGFHKLRGRSRRSASTDDRQPHGWQPRSVFSCVWDFCPAADEKAYWVFCAQTDSQCWWKRFILRVPRTRRLITL
jgi:hypothetical protein